MGLKIPEMFEEIALCDYAKEFGEAKLEVLVNPPKAVLNEQSELVDIITSTRVEMDKIIAENVPDEEHTLELRQLGDILIDVSEKMERWYTKVWYSDGKPLTFEEVDALFKEAADTDPGFIQWLIDQTIEKIFAHREKRKN